MSDRNTPSSSSLSLSSTIILNKIKKCSVVELAKISGDLRRRSTPANVDVTIRLNPKNIAKLLHYLIALGDLTRNGINHINIKLKNSLFLSNERVKLHLYDRDSWGSGLFYNTGTKEHINTVVNLLKKKGIALTEWGAFYKGKKVDNGSERSIYELAELPFYPPQMREFGTILRENLPLIRKKHVTTLLCRKGSIDIERDIERAIRKNYAEIVFIPPIALIRPRLVQYINGVKRLANKYRQKIRVLSGVELDIDHEGKVALPPLENIQHRLDVIAMGTKYLPNVVPAIRILQALENSKRVPINLITDQYLIQKNELFFQWKKIFRAANSRNIILAVASNFDANLLHKAKIEGCKFLLCERNRETINLARKSMLVPGDLVTTLKGQ